MRVLEHILSFFARPPEVDWLTAKCHATERSVLTSAASNPPLAIVTAFTANVKNRNES
jgi:hypothetical protein